MPGITVMAVNCQILLHFLICVFASIYTTYLHVKWIRIKQSNKNGICFLNHTTNILGPYPFKHFTVFSFVYVVVKH